MAAVTRGTYDAGAQPPPPVLSVARITWRWRRARRAPSRVEDEATTGWRARLTRDLQSLSVRHSLRHNSARRVRPAVGDRAAAYLRAREYFTRPPWDARGCVSHRGVITACAARPRPLFPAALVGCLPGAAHPHHAFPPRQAEAQAPTHAAPHHRLLQIARRHGAPGSSPPSTLPHFFPLRAAAHFTAAVSLARSARCLPRKPRRRRRERDKRRRSSRSATNRS